MKMHGNNKIHYTSFKSKRCCCNDHHTENIQCHEELLLHNNLDESTLVDDVKAVEGKLQSSDYNFNNQSDLSTVIMLDIMAQIRKQPTTKLKCFDDLFAAGSNSAPSPEQIDIIYDSYLDCK